MNRVILIGNGFDLAHKLNTGYKDFIDWLWEKENKDINNKKEWLFYDKIRYRQYLSRLSEERRNVYIYEDNFIILILDKIAYENTQLFSPPSPQKNIKNIFLSQINSKKTLNNWVDVEEEYYKALKTTIDPNSIVENTSTEDTNRIVKIVNTTSTYDYTYHYQIEKLNQYFDQIKVEFNKYLTEELKKETKKINGLESLIYSKFCLEDFTQNGIDNLIDIAYRKILSLKEQEEKQELDVHHASERTLRLYQTIKALVSEESTIIHEELKYSLKTKDDFVKLIKKCKDIDISYLLMPDNVLLLNFNYTNIENQYSIDNYFTNKNDGYKREFDINQETIHIHGELNNPDNPIIFGYGDELDDDYKQILRKNDNRLLENVKSVKYGETYNYKRLLKFIESDSYQIFIMGHSCGNSDRTLLNTLFEHKNCQSIKIFYHNQKDKNTDEIKDNFSDIYRNIIRNFTNFADLRAKVVDKRHSIPLPQLNMAEV